jgi:hypothetical protein
VHRANLNLASGAWHAGSRVREPDDCIENPKERPIDAFVGKRGSNCSQRLDVPSAFGPKVIDELRGNADSARRRRLRGHVDAEHDGDEVVKHREQARTLEMKHFGRHRWPAAWAYRCR